MIYGIGKRRHGKTQQQHLFRYLRHTIHLNAKDGKHETMNVKSGVLNLKSARSVHGLYIGTRPQANEVATWTVVFRARFHLGRVVPGR